MEKGKENKDFLKEDGYLSVESCSNVHRIVFHPNLNVMLIFTESSVFILDINSGVILSRISASENNKPISGKYLIEHDRILFWNDKNLGMRSVYPTGVLLLETILQAPITSTDNIVKVEILLSEAVLLYNTLLSLEQQGVENSADVTNELVQKIGEAQKRAKKGIKAQKWDTICLELPHSSLKVVASTIVMELKSLQRHIPALSIASAINERLTDLIVNGRMIENDQIQRFHMYSEAARRKTFDSWPHMDYKWALPDQMAQAGFYHQSSETGDGDDRAMCFTCSVCLVCWEKTDEPWSEHERHSPDCIFLKGEYTQNVPLSVTYATSPAVDISGFDLMSFGDCDIICMGNSNTGDINVWTVERQLEKCANFNIKTCEKNIMKRYNLENEIDINLVAMCTFKKQTVLKIKDSSFEKSKSTSISGTRIVAGVKCNGISEEKRQAFENSPTANKNLFLVLYAVTEAYKSPSNNSKPIATNINGNVNDDETVNPHSNAKNGSSLITILESSFEERLDGFDDILKFMDSKDSISKTVDPVLGSGSTKSNAWTFIPQSKNDCTEIDSEKSVVAVNGPSVQMIQKSETSLKSKSENEFVCFPIQAFQLNDIEHNFEIKEILISCDNHYLIVFLKSTVLIEKNVDYMETDETNCHRNYQAQIIVYEIDDKGLIKESTICKRKFINDDVPIEFCILPKFDTNERFFSGSPTDSNAFVITCLDGSIKVLSITTLKTLSEAKVQGEKFISTVYCKNLERLCASTLGGTLHFFSFYDLDNDSSDEIEDENFNQNENTDIKYKLILPSTSTSPPKPSDEKAIKPDIIANRKELSLSDLKTLCSLTQFDEILTPYSAEVPGCWTEIFQAKRRHPQSMGPGEDTHFTRTWRLHNDATTWDEHLIELSLPKATSIGHIDFKFSILQPCSNPPAIQVTLLKQKSIGLCCRRKPASTKHSENNEASIDVDDNINFNLNSGFSSNPFYNNSVENPVLSEEYLQARNAEILVGPIELSACMDLNEQGGTVTFISPKLLKSKARNYLIHLKTMTDVSKDGQSKTRGCDWLHEISISIRATREIPGLNNERLQRLAMLESTSLMKNLIEIAVDRNDSLKQNLAVDILYWILYVNLARYRVPKSIADINSQQTFCIGIVEENLDDIIENCILTNNRSMAKKAVKLLIASLHGARNMIDPKPCYNFETALKKSILSAIPNILKIAHAGALRWFILLIAATTNNESQGLISIEITKLLIEILGEMSKRTNKLNSLLQSRFGLYGMPFESDIFDTELQSFGKNSNNMNYSNAFLQKPGTNGNQPSQPHQNQFNDFRNICSIDNSEIRIPFHLRRKSISNHTKGLLEVEPLHFTCCSTSEATRVENMDSISMQATNVIDDILIETTPQIGTSKLTTNDYMIKMPNEKISFNNETELEKKIESTYTLAKNVVDKIFYSQIKKNKYKEPHLKTGVTSGNAPIFTGDEEFMIMQQQDTVEKEETFDLESNRTQNTLTIYNTKVRDFLEEADRDEGTNILPWHKLLGAPPKQMIVVDRMHSGARRQVTLDFGYPVLLTDIIMPACNDLASLTIDAWCFDEEGDCVRLAVCHDIAIKTLILSDLQPPPVCQYLRLTFMGRYGMSATRCKLPMGSFFGHNVILDKDCYSDPVMKILKNKKNYLKNQLKVLNALYEDTHCRYCLASSKLSDLLRPLLKCENSNMNHMQSYLNRLKETEDSNNQEYTKISTVYEECMIFQIQLNVVKNVIKRLENALYENQQVKQQNVETSLNLLSTDKLRVLSECLVESLLHFVTTYGSQSISTLHNFFDLKTCNLMFKTLVINGDSHIRIATCSMIVKMCSYSVKPWWGNFFSDIFTSLFSSQNIEIFPQDRVFILLTYLGRKSIQLGTCRTIVLDSILKTIANLLAPLSNDFDNHLRIWRNTDLTLLSWLLLFLSVCLDDNNDKKDNLNPRWDFMSGDIVKARLTMSNTNSRSFSRSFKKRFIQNKQTSSNQNNIAEKVYMMSEHIANAPSMLSTSTGNLDSVINKAQDLKNHLKKLLPGSNDNDYVFPKTFLKKTGPDGNTAKLSGAPSNTGMNKPEELINESAFDKGLKSLKTQNVLVVIRGLIGLLLSMDFTCNMDLFLLTCKIIAKLVNACKISVQLSSIITVQQLLQLVRIAVWENQQNSWAVHAITCLLQDILEADRSYKSLIGSHDSDAMDVDLNNGNEISLAQALGFITEFPSTSGESSLFKDFCNYEVFKTDSKNLLPSLIEDDTDGIEEILDDILEQSKKHTSTTTSSFTKKEPSPLTAQSRGVYTLLYRSKVSSTMDSRLEYGLDINTEIYLRRLIMKSSVNLIASLPQQESTEAICLEMPPWPESIVSAWNSPEYQQKIDTNIMLMEVFETIFTDLHLEDSWLNLEQVLQLWLTLNGDSNDLPKIIFNNLQSKIPFGEKAVNGLLKALATRPALKIRGWCLGFLCLIYSISSKPIADLDIDQAGGTGETYNKKIGNLIIKNENFEKMLLRFCNGIYKNNSIQSNGFAGPTVCRLLQELFSCLQVKCQLRDELKETLLRVCYSLVQQDGAISKSCGPIDAQNQIIKELLNYQYQKTDLVIAMSIIECVSNLIYHFITNIEKIQCQKSSDGNSNSNVFGSLFATVLGAENTQSKTVTDSTILMNLIKLSSIFIRTKLPPLVSDDITMTPMEFMQSQTDETKAEQQNQPQIKSLPTFTDTVLQHYPTMNKLLSALSYCNTSSAALLVICSIYSPMYNESKNTLSDPMNVEDALFQLIIYMNKLASQPILMIKPLFDYIKFVSNVRHAMPKIYLSEPFLWLMLKILETNIALEVFCEMGGIKILAENLVKSNRTLLNTQPNLITMIMQHLSKAQNIQAIANQTTKKSNPGSAKYDEGLINFAPYCTITSENPSAQPADVLIQGQISSHRRARAAAWSYLFYPNESHVDLILTLPTAVLLKEIQLQPHLSTLASCPSAVSIEISRDGMNLIPLTQPIMTSGMTCIRLKFPQAEIATHLVIRLYRPKDSSTIGLSMISVLGTSIFNDGNTNKSSSSNSSSNNNDMNNEEESQSEISFGWLRILAQCFNVATFNTDSNLSNMVISSASEVNGFMESCCSLLSIAPSMSNYLLQNLETVLLKLGLHNRELSLKLINILLNESIPHIFKLCNETVSDILYQLCTTSDSFARDRIEIIIDWLMNLDENSQLENVNPNSGYIKCIASILWQAYATNLVIDLGNLIKLELFERLFCWLDRISENSPMKMAFDSILCSICCIRPELFNILLRKMDVLIPTNKTDNKTTSLSDDRKDNESVTDDNKQKNNESEEWYCNYAIKSLATLNLSSSQMKTIAIACQSPLTIYQLIDSGLPNLFTTAILEFCHRASNQEQPQCSTSCLTDSDKAFKNTYPMVNVRKITEILNFMSEICAEEGHMRDWLGSYEGSMWIEPLLTLLCNNKLQSSCISDDMNNQTFLELEETVIKFLSNFTSCHPKNQDILTTNLISVIRTTEKNNYNINQQNPGCSSQPSNSASHSMKYSISGFTRRLVLQILLESEKIVVSVRSDLPLLRKYDSNMTYISNHPSKKPNSHHLLFYVSINTKCQEIMQNSISVYNNLLPSINSNDNNATRSSSDFPLDNRSDKKDLWDLGMQMNFGMEFLSVAAGVQAKDKRSKELKNQENAQRTKEFFNVFKMKPDEGKGLSDSIQFVHTACPEIILTSDTTIAQILTMLKSNGISLSTPCINLNLIQLKNNNNDESPCEVMKASDFNPLPSPLQIFSSRGGLSLLAHYLPTVYPEQPKSIQKATEKDKGLPGEWVKGEWIKIEPNEEIYEDVDDGMDSSCKMTNVISSVPQHSLAAFGLFLKLPAYSEVLLRDKVRAQCLLRLILGVSGDGEGNDIYSLALSSSLPTLPFEVLRQLLDSSPLSTDDGVLLRRMICEVGAIHLVLNCLSIFTHHNSNLVPGPEVLKSSSLKSQTVLTEEQASDDKSHVYWAKGTGFGTGSTQQSWNVEQALLKQKSEEEHVTVLLQVLSSYINPGDIIPNAESNSITYRESTSSEVYDLPPLFIDLLQKSCLIPALCSYLRNDSVLDITRHIPLYRAILQLLRALSISSQLITLLTTKQENDSKTSIAALLYNMKSCVDTYASRLKINKKSNLKGQSQKISINLDESDDEGLALLIPDIQETTALVQSATYSDSNGNKDEHHNSSHIEYPINTTIEEKYLEVMKRLQFDTFEMIAESENGYRFTVTHHFESNVRISTDRGHPGRVKRLAQEATTLSTSLPLSYSSSVFVRCDTDRLDIMKVLITGPADTPYANGCFEFDVYFPHDYPNSPMMINLETTGRHSVRFNPNLYNDGKVCLSILNTWHGRPEEKWNAQTSSFLQVLVSIQSLILVSEPYFNEPGFERSRGTPSGNHSSREYNSNIYQACVKWAMLEQIRNPSPCFKDVIYTHFWLKRNEICQQIENWISELSRPPQVSERCGRTISFNSMVLKRQYRQLRDEFAKLPVPENLKNFDNPFNSNTSPSSATASYFPMPNEKVENSEDSNDTVMEIFNAIDDQQKNVEMEFLTNNDKDDEKDDISEISLDLLDKTNKTMKDIEKMLTDD